MAYGFARIVGPGGADVFFSDGMAKIGYRITGDGTNGAINLPFHKLESVISVEADQNHNPVINPATRVVQLTIPAAASGGLANNATTDVWISGKGGH
jgi:hypothetical protein